MYDVEAWRSRQGEAGGAINEDHERIERTFDRAGAYVMGRRMFDEGEVGWPDPPPFQVPVFVVTHNRREPWVRQGGTTFTFVTDGVESAVAQACTAAGGKDVQIAGGANAIQQCLNAGLLDELELRLAPVLLGAGVPLFEGIDVDTLALETPAVVASPATTHLRYRVRQAAHQRSS